MEPENSPPTKARLPGETPSMLLVIVTATVSRFRYEKRKTSNRVMRPDPDAMAQTSLRKMPESPRGGYRLHPRRLPLTQITSLSYVR